MTCSRRVQHDALDSFMGITVRERFQLNKAEEIGGPSITAEEDAEIDELRKARDKGFAAKTPIRT